MKLQVSWQLVGYQHYTRNCGLLVCDVAAGACAVNGAEILEVCRQTRVSLQLVFPCPSQYNVRIACPAPQEH